MHAVLDPSKHIRVCTDASKFSKVGGQTPHLVYCNDIKFDGYGLYNKICF